MDYTDSERGEYDLHESQHQDVEYQKAIGTFLDEFSLFIHPAFYQYGPTMALMLGNIIAIHRGSGSEWVHITNGGLVRILQTNRSTVVTYIRIIKHRIPFIDYEIREMPRKAFYRVDYDALVLFCRDYKSGAGQ